MAGFRSLILLSTICTTFLSIVSGFSQPIRNSHPGEIFQDIQRLSFLGSALYVAAHPDDENTRMISWLANDVKARTAYLSLTRGDGGQNLIGPEIRELLGLLRTQELLAARRIDGGHQMFTRANDFGYSKTPAETMEIWNREEVLSDVVWAIRKWRPDVIINRFSHDSGRRTHGHHTASAMLSVEAFDLAGRNDIFPDQLPFTEAWQPSRLFFNTSWWFFGSREKFEAADKSTMLSVDIGTYYPLRGESNTEIAARSRSQHKCQAFGDMGSRGSQMEYLQLLKGDMPADKSNLFEGINTTWSRVPGGEKVGASLQAVEKSFRFDNPAASVPGLIETLRLLSELPQDNFWVEIKTREILKIISSCLGLYLEAVADDPTATPGEGLAIEMEATNRSEISVSFSRINLPVLGIDTTMNLLLEHNTEHKFFLSSVIPQEMKPTNPYWLEEAGTLGMYTVNDRVLIGNPETARPVTAEFTLEINGMEVVFERPLVYKYEDPAKGEVRQPFEITPPVFVNLKENVYLFPNPNPQIVPVTVRAGRDSLNGTVRLAHPEGWTVQPEELEFSLSSEGEEQVLDFTVTPGSEAGTFELLPVAEIDGKTYNRSLTLITYDHIPTQTVMMPARARATRVDLKRKGSRIGYISGSGDAIPEGLQQIGYQVDMLSEADISSSQLSVYDAVILGIRALNTRDRIKFEMPELLAYAREGGTLILQYNTSWGLQLPMSDLSPYPLNISRDRVTEEHAAVRILAPDHPVMNYPNEITIQDFDGWVQERGLYFPDEWGPEFTPILSSNDTGEPPRDGGLLIAPYGEGYYVYTGLSWFRELPAGVPGAWKLFTNIIALGDAE
jgi:LmbE family N-acetylglucosaminyl deacetylase